MVSLLLWRKVISVICMCEIIFGHYLELVVLCKVTQTDPLGPRTSFFFFFLPQQIKFSEAFGSLQMHIGNLFLVILSWLTGCSSFSATVCFLAQHNSACDPLSFSEAIFLLQSFLLKISKLITIKGLLCF